MAQQPCGNLILSRNFCTSSSEMSNWSNERQFERTFNTQVNDPARYNATPIHPRSLSIEAVLKGCVGIQGVKEFGVFLLCENGEEKTYSSQSLTPYLQTIFGSRFRASFYNSVRQANSDGSCSMSAYSYENNLFSEFDGSESSDNRKASAIGEDSSSSSHRRRQQQLPQEEPDCGESGTITRRRHRGRYVQFGQELTQPIPVIKTQQLRIGDEEEVFRFIVNRFKDMQQNACKVIGKAFVKLIEPKKQTRYPYTKGALKSPPWWPSITGENGVRHKEPDHLLKAERIRLLVHIIQMIVEPFRKQQPAVQKLGLNVKKLEEVTMEAMKNWFNDKEHPANAQKRPLLKEIFKVAMLQERYKNGEIDESSRVNVMLHESFANSCNDEPDDGDEYDKAEAAAARVPTESLVPPNTSIMQTIQRPIGVSRNRGEIELAGRQRRRPLPVRYHTHPQSFGDQKMEDPQPSLFQPDACSYKWEMNSTPSYQQPTSDLEYYALNPSPQQQQQSNMYNWQSNNMPTLNTSTGGPSPQPFYAISPHSADSRGYQLPPLLPLTQQNMLPPPIDLSHPGYESLPIGNRYDTGPATMGTKLRTGGLAHQYTGREHN